MPRTWAMLPSFIFLLRQNNNRPKNSLRHNISVNL
jgi:hypothetical protein